MLVSAIS